MSEIERKEMQHAVDWAGLNGHIKIYETQNETQCDIKTTPGVVAELKNKMFQV